MLYKIQPTGPARMNIGRGYANYNIKLTCDLKFQSHAWVTECHIYRDVPDIRLNRISGQDLGIRFNRISGIRYIMISGIIRYPVEYQFRYYPVPLSLDSYLILDHLKCVRSLEKSSLDVNFIKKFFLVESQTHPQSGIRYYPECGIRYPAVADIRYYPVKFDIR